MTFDFDPGKDAANIAKHGLSLAEFSGFDGDTITVPDRRRDYGEERFLTYGLIGSNAHCLTYTMRGEVIRLISFRRAHLKEYRRHVS